MEIYNKIASAKKIKELNLNILPEKIFNELNEQEINNFLEDNPAEYYAIRDKSKSGGKFKLKVERKDVIREVQEYSCFSINISSINYSDNQILVGEMEVLSNNNIYLTVTTDKNASVRDAYSNPEYNLYTNIYDKRINNIPGFDYVYNYILENNLINVIVEFALYDIDVGINNKKIVIFELRTNY